MKKKYLVVSDTENLTIRLEDLQTKERYYKTFSSYDKFMQELQKWGKG